MLFRKEKILPAEQNPTEEIQRTPEHSPEISSIVEQIDYKIAESENLLKGLGRIARERIIDNPEVLEEIYAPKEIGRMDLKGEHDALALESASKGLLVKNAIKKVLTLTRTDSKHALKNYDGELVDKRKLKKEVIGEKYEVIKYTGELNEVVKNFNLDPEKIDPQDLAKIYIEGERGKAAEKIILQRKTEQEIDNIAGNIFEKRLKEIETKDGADLVKQKESLEEFKKEKEQYKSVLNEEKLNKKLNDEEVMRQANIDEKQKILNSDLEIIRSPLLEQRKNITQVLENFSPLLNAVNSQEKIYLDEIKDLQNKITKISGTKQLKEVLGDEIKKWEEEKKQAEINLKDFKEKKEALNKRIIELKKSQAEVDTTITRINNIGKTKEELKKEKLKQEKPDESKFVSDQARPLVQMTEEEARQWQDAGWQSRITYEKSGGGDKKVVTQVEKPESGDDSGKKAAQVASAGTTAETLPVVSAFTGKVIRGKISGNKLKTEAVATAAAEQNITKELQKDKEKVKKRVSQWLALLGIQNNTDDEKGLIDKYFIVDNKFDKTASMTLSEVRKAYRGFLKESKKLSAKQAKDEVNKKFHAMSQNIND